ncbi:uncharacterized protein LOC113372975 isoform X2 [Ctenocephalides felis]|uniref:uncharacterized protein LOC113372975 isoform X2 n=1 Tax=Ctenocephalides felis TaxID=7515 RepID=UPI000E6E143E|nr:uncharacterized protein LOC113372975 isoform X2 [Ctenocephalides felis]
MIIEKGLRSLIDLNLLLNSGHTTANSKMQESSFRLLYLESFQKHFTRFFQLLLLCTLTPSPGILPGTFLQVLSTTAALHTDSFTRNPFRNILPVLSTTAALQTDFFTRNPSRNILPGPFNYCCSAHCLLHQESFQKQSIPVLSGPFNYCCSAHCLLHQESFQKQSIPV